MRLACLGSLGFAILAQAQTSPKIAVLPLPGEIGQSATQAVASELKKNPRVTVIETTQVQSYLRNQQGGSSEGGIDAADRKFKAGADAYAKLRMKDSINLLQEAKILYRQNLKNPKAFEGLRSTQYYLAMAFLAQKQEERAKDEVRQAYILDPERTTRKLSEKLYPPSIRNLHDQIRKEFSSKSVGDLEVISFPPGALATVDGKSIGMTPATAKDLPVGEHFIRIVSDDQTVDAFGSKYVISGPNRYEPDVNVTAPQNAFQFFEAVDPPTDLPAQRAAFLDSMGVGIGAEIFVFLSAGNQEVKGQLYDQRSQALSSPVSEKSPDLLVQKLLRFVGEDGYVVAAPRADATSLASSAEPGPSEGPVNLAPRERSENADALVRQARRSRGSDGGWLSNKKNWLWIGGGVVVAAAGGFLATSLGSSGSSNSVLTVGIP